MVASSSASASRANAPQTAHRRRRWLWLAVPVLAIPAAVMGASWWLAEPLDEPAGPRRVVHVTARPVPPPAETEAAADTETAADTVPEWPDGRLEGDAAKQVLLETLLATSEELDKIDGYTCIFRKRERINGHLGELQTMEMKVRNEPFAVYLKFVSPQAGKEVVYCEGRHENKVIAHPSGGLGRLLLPRLAVPPTDPVALAENRHPITDAGLAALVRKLVGYRQMDMGDPEAVTILDRTMNAQGEPVLRSIHTHPNRNAKRPFARVEVLYDPETRLPIEISNYDWPEPGQTGELLLAEHYEYDDLNLEADLSDIDFDPANPAYAFHRY